MAEPGAGGESTLRRMAAHWDRLGASPWRLVAAALAGAAAMGIRGTMEPWLHGTVPFAFAFPAVAMAALSWGVAAGLMASAASAALAAALLLPSDLPGPAPGGLVQTLMFLPGAILVSLSCGMLSRARAAQPRRRAIDRGPAAGGRGTTDPRAVPWLQGAMLAAGLLPAAFFAVAAGHDYDWYMQEGAERADRAARIAREHALKMLETNEALTGRVLELLGERDDARLRADEAALHRALQGMAGHIPQIRGLWVWDAAGRPVASSLVYPVPATLDISARDSFARHRDAGAVTAVSTLIEPTGGGERFFSVSTRRTRPDGTFGGAVTVALRPQYLEDFYAEVGRAERGMAMALVRGDGAVLARQPRAPGIDERLSADPRDPLAGLEAGEAVGSAEGLSSLDPQRRLWAWRRVDDFPVFVVAGLSRDALLAGWIDNLIVVAGFTFPTAAGLMLVSWIALRMTRREFGALERLREESGRRRDAEDALRQAQKLEALGHLTGGVAHDFGNLLAVVNNNVQLLRRQRAGGAEAGEAQVEAIARAVDTGTRLTRQLLAFSRRQPLQPEAIRLQERFDEMLALLRQALPREIALDGEVDPATAAIEVDRAELDMALINLAVNARDAMPQGGRLRLEARDARPDELPGTPGAFVRIAMSDTGHGMAPEVLERVFEPFFTTKEPGKGTGLGLSQVYGFCAQSGGTVRLDSRIGGGTTVALYLPAALQDPHRAAPRIRLD